MATIGRLVPEDAGPGWSRLVMSELDPQTGINTTIGSVVIDADSIWSLIQQLLNSVQPARLALDHARGNCAACQNVRTVKVINRHGHPESVRCAACQADRPEPLHPWGLVPRPEESPAS